MAENKMEEVAALFGLEMGERFCIDGCERDYEYAFDDKGLYYINPRSAVFYANELIPALLTGVKTIIKKPWKPETGSIYFWAGHNNIYESCWKGDMRDYAFYAVGNCFETRNEAFTHREKVVACLKSIYENGRQE